MNRSYTIMAMTMAMMLVAGTAMADSVDIGLGRMDRSEFEALKQVMRGEQPAGVSVTTERPKETRVAEFDRSVVEDIRLAMGDRFQQDAVASASDNQLVDIGLGSMSTNEFCDLNKLVASNTANDSGFEYLCP